MNGFDYTQIKAEAFLDGLRAGKYAAEKQLQKAQQELHQLRIKMAVNELRRERS